VILDELLSRRLLILSGKGGVGKSVVGMALALAAHRRGKRVLFVEVDAALPAARLLGEEAGLSSVNLDPPGVMDEYVRQTVRVDLLARKVLDSGIAPIINTGIAHKEAGVGQIGAGITHAPLECFAPAIAALAARVSA